MTRILLGPARHTVEGMQALRTNDEVLTFSYGDWGDIQYDYKTEGLTQVLQRLPSGWEPDLVVWWSLDYYALPEDMADCLFPLAAALGDWNLRLSSFYESLSAFDVLLTDKLGFEKLAAAGFKNLYFLPQYSHLGMHQGNALAPRRYDISFVGNLNSYVQSQRGGWLRRIAALGERYNVHINSHIHGERYVELLADSRIVFNNSIRGEMNMRCFEATACGALLFIEESNQEVFEFLSPGEECVAYNEENLEELLSKYLDDEALRQRVAAAGQRKTQGLGYRETLQGLQRLASSVEPVSRKPLAELAKARQNYRARPREAVFKSLKSSLTLAASKDAASLGAHLSGVVLAELAIHARKEPKAPEWLSSSIQYLERAQSGCNLALFNLGYLLDVNLERSAEAKLCFEAFLSATAEVNSLSGTDLLPGRYEALGVAWEHLLRESLLGDGKTETLRMLARQYAQIWLSEIERKSGNVQKAVEYAQAAVSLDASSSGEVHYLASRILLDTGNYQNALECVEEAVLREPFLATYWVQHLEALRRVGKVSECARACEEYLAAIDVCPVYSEFRFPITDVQTVVYLEALLEREGATDDFFVIQLGAHRGGSINEGKDIFSEERIDPLHRLIRKFHWKGILVEPQEKLFQELTDFYQNEPQLCFEQLAVFSEDGERDLYLSENDYHASLFTDRGDEKRKVTGKQKVRCTTLNSLVAKHRPEKIDLLCIDTEGSEYEILKDFDFESLSPRYIFFEHRHVPLRDRKALIQLLLEKGYRFLIRGEFDALAELIPA